ncbi:hypothetical protein [Paenibacillus kandeliae]|uniref:hypothetical protein n=1 Tax=Paenibacillus kandeliae TaxID=3231269 RepID=UPI00345A6692
MSLRNNKKDTAYIESVLASQLPTNFEKELCEIAKYYMEQSEERSVIAHQIFLGWVKDKRLANNSNELYKSLQAAEAEVRRKQSEIKSITEKMQQIAKGILFEFTNQDDNSGSNTKVESL